MTVFELLQKGESIFRKIDESIIEDNGSYDYTDAFQIIDKAVPPSEWILELPSKIKKGESYKSVPLDLMELAAKRIFGIAFISKVLHSYVTQDKSGSLVVTVSIEYRLGNTLVLPGIASVPISSIQLLELATPKASSMAVKNALKQLGGLFGKYLNRSEDQEELPNFVEEVELTEETLAKRLAVCESFDDLKSYRLLVYKKGVSSDIQSIYENRLRELKNKK